MPMKRSNLAACVILFTSFGAAAQSSRRPDVELRQYNGRPTIFIDNKPLALAGYNTFHKRAFDRSMPIAYQHKFSVYFIYPDSWPDSSRGNAFWRGDEIGPPPSRPGTFGLDEQAAHILKGDPDAFIIVRFTPYPPGSWHDLHPQEYFVADDESIGRVPSLASKLTFDCVSRYSAAVVRYCESRPWADRIAAYANFGIVEGTHYPLAEGWLYDHNPLMVARWREFLKRKYGTVERLRAAHDDPAASFDSILVPHDKLNGPTRQVSDLLYWQAAKQNQPLRDYLELQSELFKQSIRDYGLAMKSAVNRKMVFVHDSLKQTMLGWHNFGFFDVPNNGGGVSWPLAYPEMTAGSGSMGVAGLLGAPGVDGLITPLDYQARGLGGVCETEGIADSAILRGLLYYGEMDIRTPGTQGNEIGKARDAGEFAALVWRNLATGWTRGFSSYFMEFGGGWFDPPELQAIIHRQVQAIRQSIEWPHKTVPGIAMILDDASLLETNGNGAFLNEAVMWEQKMGIARCGVPHNIYLLEDLELDNFPRHRVFYFPNLFKVDAKRLELLKKKVFRDGNVVVWGPGSGISDGETIGTASAARLTGFEFEMIRVNSQRRILISNFDHPVTKGLAADQFIGGPLPYGPVLLPTDGLELGTAWVKGGHIHMGMSLKEFGRGAAGNGKPGPRGDGDFAAVFMTAVNLPANLWRNLARYAGAHVYSDTNDVLVADSSIVAVHSLQSGKKRIALPGQYRVREVITGKPYAASTSEIVFDLKAPETRIFLLEGR